MATQPKTIKTDLREYELALNEKHSELIEERKCNKKLNERLKIAEAVADEIRRTCKYDPTFPDWITGKGVHHGARGGPLVMLSDIHYGEYVKSAQMNEVNEYTPEIALKRLKTFVNNTIDLCENPIGRKTAKYPGLVLCLGGDMISGSIQEELRWTDLRTPEESKQELSDGLAGVIDNLATHFGRLFIPAVVGNHGRETIKTHYKNTVAHNHDWGLYMNLNRVFKGNKNIRFYIPEAFDAYFTLFGHRFFLTHGDCIGSGGGDGITGNLNKIARGAVKIRNSEAQIGRNVDTALFGHFHSYLDLQTVVVNGSVKGYDQYARLALRSLYEPPTQALLLVHPDWGRTHRTPVYLEQKTTARANQVWVEWAA